VFGLSALVVGALVAGVPDAPPDLVSRLVLFGLLQTLANFGFYALALGGRARPRCSRRSASRTSSAAWAAPRSSRC
jgi:hypothetical protein